MISKGHMSLVVGAALVWSGCGSQETTAPEASATPPLEVSFAKGGKPKPPTLPGDCLVGQTVVWDGTAFVCADPSITGWEVVQQSFSGTTGGAAACPVGKVILAGGFRTPNEYRSQTIATILVNEPVQIGQNQWGWSVVGTDFPRGNWVIYAVCSDQS